MNPLLAAGVTAGANLIQSGINTWATMREGKKSRDHSMEMAKYQYQKDLEMWNRQNAYNTPAEQMKRYKDAGLNPHLIYSQGSPGNASEMPRFSKPHSRFPYKPIEFDLNNMFQNYFTAAKNAAEVENIQQATENAKIDEQMKRINAEMLGYDLDFKPEQIQHQREIYKLEEAKRSQELEKIANEIGISREQLNWLMQKNAEMKEHGVNIEKDSLLQRKLFQTLDDFVSGKTEISTDQAIAIAGLLLWFTPVGKLGKVGGLLKKMPKGVLKKIPKVKTAPKTTRPNAQTRQNYLDKVAEKVRNSLKNMKTKD